MRLKFAVLIIAALIVSGCSSPGALRSSGPDLNLTSNKPAKVVAPCIADGWENSGVFGNVPISMRPTQMGYSVSWINGAGGVGMLADIGEEGTGSRTKYYRGAVLGSSGFEAAVKNCQ